MESCHEVSLLLSPFSLIVLHALLFRLFMSGFYVRDAANRTTNSALQGCLQAWLEDLQHQPWKPWVSNSRPYTLAIDCQGRRQTSRVEEGEPVGGEEDSQATEAPVCPHSTNPHKWLYLRKMPAGLRLPYWASQPQPAVQLDVILLLRCRFPLSSETDGCQHYVRVLVKLLNS